MKKALMVLALIATVFAGLAVWYARRPRQTPRGQEPLESLNAANLGDFQKAFNSSPSSVRLVLLFSPT